MKALTQDLGCLVGAVDLAEVYNPGCFAKEARVFGPTPGGVYDARHGWGLSDLNAQERCEAEIDETEHMLAFGSPPCGPLTNAM